MNICVHLLVNVINLFLHVLLHSVNLRCDTTLCLVKFSFMDFDLALDSFLPFITQLFLLNDLLDRFVNKRFNLVEEVLPLLLLALLFFTFMLYNKIINWWNQNAKLLKY